MNLQDFLDAQDRLDVAKEELYQAEDAFNKMGEKLAYEILVSNFWTRDELKHERWQQRMKKIFTYKDSLWEIEWVPSVVKGCPPHIKSLRQITQPTELKDLPE